MKSDSSDMLADIEMKKRKCYDLVTRYPLQAHPTKQGYKEKVDRDPPKKKDNRKTLSNELAKVLPRPKS